MMLSRRSVWLIAIAVGLCTGVAARATDCDDGNPCTGPDTCTANACSGPPKTGECDAFDDCAITSMCQSLPGVPLLCLPTVFKQPGTPCGGGCGTCQAVAGGATSCQGDPANHGMACDPGINNPCLDGQCEYIDAANFHFAMCGPAVRDCPDTDGDPCTDACNFATGQCEQSAPKCVPFCETCNHKTGECVPDHIGQACDEPTNVCSAENHCDVVPLGGGIQRGLCQPGAATVPTPTITVGCPAGVSAGAIGAGACATATATATPMVATSPTATASSTVTPPTGGGTPTATQSGGVCAGDCNRDGMVTINELITGVNIALGSAPASNCPAADVNGDLSVAINELIAAVNRALNGCQ